MAKTVSLPAPPGAYGGDGDYYYFTRGEWKAVFGRLEPEQLVPVGCGSYACVWRHRDRAFKVTEDATDAAALLKAQGVPHVLRVHRAHRLKPRGDMPNRSGELFALQVEYLPGKVSTAAYAAIKAGKTDEKACDAQGERREWCLGAAAAYRDLRDRGINPCDDHAYNFGVDDEGDWKFLDLGESCTFRPTRKQAPTLRGTKRR